MGDITICAPRSNWSFIQSLCMKHRQRKWSCHHAATVDAQAAQTHNLRWNSRPGNLRAHKTYASKVPNLFLDMKLRLPLEHVPVLPVTPGCKCSISHLQSTHCPCSAGCRCFGTNLHPPNSNTLLDFAQGHKYCDSAGTNPKLLVQGSNGGPSHWWHGNTHQWPALSTLTAPGHQAESPWASWDDQKEKNNTISATTCNQVTGAGVMVKTTWYSHLHKAEVS